ncbi:MAG: hypothetical protein ACTHOG_07680 [Marmoricola sp.]
MFAASFALALPLAGAPAFADEPANWQAQSTHSFWNYFVLLILIPGALALTIGVLVVLPSLVKGDSYDPTKAWSGMRGGSAEWFGGPAKGTDQAAAPKAEGSGGASASW